MRTYECHRYTFSDPFAVVLPSTDTIRPVTIAIGSLRLVDLGFFQQGIQQVAVQLGALAQ